MFSSVRNIFHRRLIMYNCRTTRGILHKWSLKSGDRIVVSIQFMTRHSRFHQYILIWIVWIFNYLFQTWSCRSTDTFNKTWIWINIWKPIKVISWLDFLYWGIILLYFNLKQLLILRDDLCNIWGHRDDVLPILIEITTLIAIFLSRLAAVRVLPQELKVLPNGA